jgi:cytochrome c oxidase subunit I+III
MTTATVAAARRRPGVLGWISDVRGEATGMRLVVTGLAFFGLAGLAALLIRLQLATPDASFLNPEAYEQLFSVHGTTMMFMFVVPVLEGIALRLVPSEIGAAEIALPRLAAFAYWIYLAAGLAIWVSLAFGQAPDSGWFNYLPLASPRYQPGFHGDVYAAAVILSMTATVALAISIITTIVARRAPGMSPYRMPLMAWAVLVATLVVVVAMPTVIVAATMLTFDSKLGTHFFSAATGGDPLLWQHLFWFFGHPLVYLMLLPGLGIVSSITPTFARHAMVGYRWVASSYLSIGVISFMVWVHHMFATPTAQAGRTAFSVATMAVAVPSGIHVFAVLATLWHGRVRFEVPLLFVLGFVAVFVTGGISGVMVGSTTADWQYTDTYFVVAHLHFVLLGGVVLPLFGGLHYWYPKVTGRMPGRRLGVAAFAAMFAGILVAFMPMHLTGLLGMPRRVWTYPEGLGWDGVNLVSTIGAFLIGLGVLLFLVNMVVSLRGRPAPPDPWGSGTLDWAPAPPPVVTSHYPLWEQPDEVGRGDLVGAPALPTPLPALAGVCLAAGVLGTILDPLLLGAGLALAFVAVVEWLRTAPPDPARHLRDRTELWWGTATGLLAVFVAVGALVGSWYYLAAQNGQWPLPPVEPRPLGWGIAETLLLGVAAFLVVRAAGGLGRAGRPVLTLAGGAVAGVLFVAVVAVELLDLDYTQAENASASVEWAISIVTALMVLTLAGAAAVGAAWVRSGRIPAARPGGLVAIAMYAGLLSVSWPLIAFTLYVAPRL